MLTLPSHNGPRTDLQPARQDPAHQRRLDPRRQPFVGSGKLGSIWAYGFRNPWRFQFDSATGMLYNSDVGDFSWEELNRVVKGGNYGWPLREGVCQSDCTGFIDPIHAYPHAGESAAAAGGPVYRGGMLPAEYQGSLFFGDYAQGFIKRAKLDANGNVTSVSDFDPAAGSVSGLKVAPDGSLYYINYPGELYRVSYNTNSMPRSPVLPRTSPGRGAVDVHYSSATGGGPTRPADLTCGRSATGRRAPRPTRSRHIQTRASSRRGSRSPLGATRQPRRRS
jgi:hypothetical protein